jgi:MFS transporter, FSR family, fosmidomycin resistance protein
MDGHHPTSEKGPTRMPDAAPVAGMNRRGVAMMSASHVVDDIYQGCIPALLPFFVAERHYSYAAISGLTLAATVLSSVAQPLFGWWTDRAPRRWMIAVGILTAASGVALAGLFHSYAVTWLVIALSGLGIAAFHPEAARAARQAAGDSNRGMSVFALGGNVGFALGTLVATPVLLLIGLRGTVLLAVPGALMAVLLLMRLNRTLDGPVGAPHVLRLPVGDDDWPAFRRLTAVVVARSILFFGLTSFIALYFIHERGTSTAVGGAALTTFLAAGAVGTLLGGWLADRSGRVTTIRLGLAVIPPALVGMLIAPNLAVAFPLVALVGITTFMPFSVFVVLGQDYLPNRIGTASGVTVGLAVSVGGLFTPVFGWIADATSLQTTFWLLVALPVLGLALSMRLRAPTPTGTAPPGEDVAVPGLP